MSGYTFRIDPEKFGELFKQLQECDTFGTPRDVRITTWSRTTYDHGFVVRHYVKLTRQQVQLLGRRLNASAIEDAFGLKEETEE